MRIKAPSRAQKKRALLKAIKSHWWLVEDKPKKVGRLSSQNKQNKLRRRRVGPSEFIKMVESIEARPNKGVFNGRN